ncbi:MAG: response regulator, partial [Chitinispirillaceae bacterium]|nr:response regulator [Chitinispirillaceae bacterium]
TIAYSIVKKHGGHIEFETKEGEGSTFSFYLPLVHNQKIEEKREEVVETIQSSSPPGNILLMDDDVIIKTVVEKLLKKAGYHIKSVSDGEECIEAYVEALTNQDPFQLVIMDLTIAGGGMGGKETVKKIKELDSNAKVIVFSGYSNDPILANYKEYGFDGVLRKPFTTDELMELIRRLT